MLGSTGSIGESTLDVIRRHPERWSVFALSANTNVACMLEQCREFRPRYAVMRDESAAAELASTLRDESIETKVLAGSAALDTIASDDNVDVVMAAIVGAAGLDSSLAAAMTGKKVLLANKESLVMSGRLFMRAAERSGAQLLPIDSEHNAIFQCMPHGYKAGERAAGVTRILLTGSGGPFRELPLSEFGQISPAQACNHPNWDMGAKISVDSATMMNKGLEVIEAHWLFNAAPEKIQVVIHPQSVIHSMVEYIDGSVLAQLGNPDMRTPIAHALGYPERIESGVSSLDMFKVAQLDFEAPDLARFPCLRLAYQALAGGGNMPAILNAANEIAVESFLEGRMSFTAIPSMIEQTMQTVTQRDVATLDDVLEADKLAREVALERLASQV